MTHQINYSTKQYLATSTWHLNIFGRYHFPTKTKIEEGRHNYTYVIWLGMYTSFNWPKSCQIFVLIYFIINSIVCLEDTDIHPNSNTTRNVAFCQGQKPWQNAEILGKWTFARSRIPSKSAHRKWPCQGFSSLQMCSWHRPWLNPWQIVSA